MMTEAAILVVVVVAAETEVEEAEGEATFHARGIHQVQQFLL
jgi:hypothetical protein